MEDDNIERHEGSLMGCDPIVDNVGSGGVELLWTEPIPVEWRDVTDVVMGGGSSRPSNWCDKGVG